MSSSASSQSATAPRLPEEAQQIGPEVQAAIAVAVAAILAASAYAAVLAAAGWTVERLTASLTALLRPLAVVRITLLGRYIEQQWNDTLFNTSRPLEDVWREIMLTEMEYERRFAKRSAERLARSMDRAAARGLDLDEAHRKALAREARFERMRQQAVIRRVTLRLEEEWVRDQSPDGAYWVMDPTKKMHTPDCLAMANKAWTWSVLGLVRPSNRHNLCGCRLVPLPMARANVMPDANVVRTEVPSAARHGHL